MRSDSLGDNPWGVRFALGDCLESITLKALEEAAQPWGFYYKEAQPWGFYYKTQEKEPEEHKKVTRRQAGVNLANVLSAFSYTVVPIACFRLLSVLFANTRAKTPPDIVHAYSLLTRGAMEMTCIFTSCLRPFLLTVDLFLFFLRSFPTFIFLLVEEVFRETPTKKEENPSADSNIPVEAHKKA